MAENMTMTLGESSTNQSDCNVFVYNSASVVLFPIFYAVVLVISLCGNSVVMYVICWKMKKFNSISVYLVNLALSDGLVTLALPGRIIYYIRDYDWPFGDFFCRLTALLYFANTYAGIGFMTCISLDRYIALVHPKRLQGLRSVRVVRRICCLVWLLVSIMNAPVLFRSMLHQQQQRRTCMEYFNFEDLHLTPYLLLLACAVSFCAPLSVIIVCYTKINLKLREAAKQSSITGQSKRTHRANAIILVILVTFIVCFSPYHINLIQFMSRKIHHRPSCQELKAFKLSLQVTVSLMNVNCCLDPVIYFFAIKTYKKKVMSILKTFTASCHLVTTDSSSNNTQN